VRDCSDPAEFLSAPLTLRPLSSEPALPTLPFELQRLIILEAATSTSAVYEGADLAPWRERQTFLKRACEVSTGWRVRSLGGAGLPSLCSKTDERDPRQYVAQPLLYQQPLLAFESRPGVDYNRPLKIFNLGLRIQRPSSQILSTPSGPISLGIFHGSEKNEELPLRRYSGLSLPNLPSLDAGEDYGSPSRVISLSNLTLETDHHAWGAVINLLLVCDFSSLERICLSVPYCLDATLSVFLLELPRLVDLRINTTTDDLNASEHLQIILASAASRLRVLHLHTIESVDLDPRLFDGLQRLEELSISTWGISTLFANGRLPRLRRLFIGQPHIKAGELLQQTDDEPLKTIQELVTWAVRTIPNLNRRRGLRLGVWDLDFGGSYVYKALELSRSFQARLTSPALCASLVGIGRRPSSTPSITSSSQRHSSCWIVGRPNLTQSGRASPFLGRPSAAAGLRARPRRERRAGAESRASERTRMMEHLLIMAPPRRALLGAAGAGGRRPP
jgi:hypothetical protein